MQRFLSAICLTAILIALTALVVHGAEPAQPLKGRVTAVKLEQKEIVVRTADGQDVTLRLDDATKIQVGGKDVKLDGLPAKTRVVIAWQEVGDQKKVVSITESRVTGKDVLKGIGEAFSTAKAYAFAKKDEFAAVTENALGEVGESLTDLEAKAAKQGEAAKAEFAKLKTEAAAKTDEVKKNLAKAATVGAEGWVEAQAEVRRSIGELQKIYERAREKFDKE